MPEVNRKKVRAMASELAQAPEGEILERFKSSMTTSEFEALQRVCRDRGIAVPAEHGEITPEPDLPQRIISAEELAGVDVAQVKKATSFGWSEGISLLAGVGMAIGLWKGDIWIALFYGVVTAVVLYLCSVMPVRPGLSSAKPRSQAKSPKGRKRSNSRLSAGDQQRLTPLGLCRFFRVPRFLHICFLLC